MKIKITCILIIAGFALTLIGCKPKLTPEQQRQLTEQQKQREERWRKTQDFIAQRAQQDAQKQAAETAKHHKAANASVSYDEYNIRIKNSDTNDWPELNIYINSGFLGPMSGYGIRLPALQTGKSITIPLNQFTKDNGERFNPAAFKITELWIGGGDYDYEKFGAN